MPFGRYYSKQNVLGCTVDSGFNLRGDFPFLCHVVPARGNDGTSEHDAEDDETAREADRFEWAKGVLNMMQRHEFHIDFMEDAE